MAFVPNAEAVAKSAMSLIDSTLADKYASLIKFLAINPEMASSIRGKNPPALGSEAYIKVQALNFSSARKPHAPEAPKTVPDEMVSVILENYFDVPKADLERVKREHLLSMGAENLVGELLERYLAKVMEPCGWIWCSGSTVKAVDLIKPPVAPNGTWELLQVKNRDNSENSSSSAIRYGTSINKWFRTFSKRQGSNWAKFPDAEIRPLVSETEFQIYVVEYLRALE